MYPRFGSLALVTPYGLMLVTGLLACWYYARRRAAGFGIDNSHIDLALPLVFAVSFVGSQLLTAARSGDNLFHAGSSFPHAHLSVLDLLLFAIPALILYSRLAALSPGKMLDLFALPALVCLMLTRLGCFMAGCCWGDLAEPAPPALDIHAPSMAAQVSTLPWLAFEHPLAAVSFPAGSFAWRQHLELGLIPPGSDASLPVHPTQLYEFFLLAVLILVLRRVEHRWTRPGNTLLVALGSYAALRFFIEFLRADNVLVSGHLTAIQLMCIALLLICGLTSMTAGKHTGLGSRR